jgi:hypothetical protein
VAALSVPSVHGSLLGDTLHFPPASKSQFKSHSFSTEFVLSELHLCQQYSHQHECLAHTLFLKNVSKELKRKKKGRQFTYFINNVQVDLYRHEKKNKKRKKKTSEKEKKKKQKKTV